MPHRKARPKTQRRVNRSQSWFTSVRLRNFRCYEDTGDVPLRPLTIVIGPNNAGKSTILDSILLLKQTVEDVQGELPLVTSGPIVDLGGYFDIVRGGSRDSSRSLGISVELALKGPNPFTPAAKPGAKRPESKRAGLSIDVSFNRKRNQTAVVSSKLTRDGKTDLEYRRRGQHFELVGVRDDVKRATAVHPINFLAICHARGRTPPELKKTVTELTDASYRNSFAWVSAFRSVHLVAPHRSPIPRYSVLGRTSGQEAGTGEETLRMLRNETPLPIINRPLIEVVADWVTRKLKLLRRLKFESVDSGGVIRSLIGDEIGGFRGVNVANMGEGFSQLLPILVRVLDGYGDCILVEQPELHLHPALQADLADLFISMLKEGGADQFIVETHSEHLLLRLRRRIAQRVLSPDEVSILYVERKGEQSQVRRLEVKPDGHFEGWPAKGFFEQGFREAYELSVEARKHHDRDESI